MSGAQQVIVIGGGLVGCSTAYRLGRAGMRVTLLEGGAFGANAASTRAAGMLGAQIEAHDSAAMDELCLRSRDRFGDWVSEIERDSGLEVGYRVSGALKLAFDRDGEAKLAAEVDAQRELARQAELLTGDEARRLEPSLSPRVRAAARYERDGLVDPPRLLKATRLAAERVGAALRSGAHVARLDGRSGVVLEGGERMAADVVVIAAGSWSSLVGNLELPVELIRPVRGQMLVLQLPRRPFSHIIDSARAYLAPRDDGRVLVGSTIEHVGFEEAVTAKATHELLGGAMAAVPQLEGAHLVDSWSGFRAAARDHLPIFDVRGGLVLATGHYRNGVLLSPITADIVHALISGEEPPVDIAPFGLGRLLDGASA